MDSDGEVILYENIRKFELYGVIKVKISVEDVKYIAKLAKLSITSEQAQKMVKEFESVDRLDLKAVRTDPQYRNAEPVLRKDEISVFEDKEKLLQNSKSLRDDYITVPKIIE